MPRRSPPPPPTPRPSVALLTALGYLQDLHDGEAVDDLDELATNAGLLRAEMMPLIDRAEEKGYLSVDDDGSVRLTQKGWRWYEAHTDAEMFSRSLSANSESPMASSKDIL